MSLTRIDYLKHYLGKECTVEDPECLMSGTIEDFDFVNNRVSVSALDVSLDVDPKYVKPKTKTFSDLDQDDLDTLINNMVVNSVKQKTKDFNVYQRTENFILLHSEKFNVSIKRNWGMFCMGVDGSIASPVDNTATLIFLLCKMNYDVAEVFQ